MLAFTATPQMIHVWGFSTVASCMLGNVWILRFWVFATGSCLPRVMTTSLGTFSHCHGSQPWTCLDCSRWQVGG